MRQNQWTESYQGIHQRHKGFLLHLSKKIHRGSDIKGKRFSLNRQSRISSKTGLHRPSKDRGQCECLSENKVWSRRVFVMTVSDLTDRNPERSCWPSPTPKETVTQSWR
jgi:hypothetical protein